MMMANYHRVSTGWSFFSLLLANNSKICWFKHIHFQSLQIESKREKKFEKKSSITKYYNLILIGHFEGERIQREGAISNILYDRALPLCYRGRNSRPLQPNMNFSFPVLFLLCLPLACPAFYLAYKLASKRQLGSIFNQNIFFLFIVTGGCSRVYILTRNPYLSYIPRGQKIKNCSQKGNLFPKFLI